MQYIHEAVETHLSKVLTGAGTCAGHLAALQWEAEEGACGCRHTTCAGWPVTLCICAICKTCVHNMGNPFIQPSYLIEMLHRAGSSCRIPNGRRGACMSIFLRRHNIVTGRPRDAHDAAIPNKMVVLPLWLRWWKSCAVHTTRCVDCLAMTVHTTCLGPPTGKHPVYCYVYLVYVLARAPGVSLVVLQTNLGAGSSAVNGVVVVTGVS